MKSQKGITLIALIITIVVLLILATVAIVSANGEKIFEYAHNAANSYDKDQKNELSIANYVEIYYKEHINNNID